MGGSRACKGLGKSRFCTQQSLPCSRLTACRTLGFPGSHASLLFLGITWELVLVQWAAPCPALPCPVCPECPENWPSGTRHNPSCPGPPIYQHFHCSHHAPPVVRSRETPPHCPTSQQTCHGHPESSPPSTRCDRECLIKPNMPLIVRCIIIF